MENEHDENNKINKIDNPIDNTKKSTKQKE